MQKTQNDFFIWNYKVSWYWQLPLKLLLLASYFIYLFSLWLQIKHWIIIHSLVAICDKSLHISLFVVTHSELFKTCIFQTNNIFTWGLVTGFFFFPPRYFCYAILNRNTVLPFKWKKLFFSLITFFAFKKKQKTKKKTKIRERGKKANQKNPTE